MYVFCTPFATGLIYVSTSKKKAVHCSMPSRPSADRSTYTEEGEERKAAKFANRNNEAILGDGGEDAAARGWGLREYDRRP
jgi:hypothetical protein